MADLADISAATTAGYKEVVLDRGSGVAASSRYVVTLKKQLVGGRASVRHDLACVRPGGRRRLLLTQALANLNGKRAVRYMGANDAYGAALVVDVN